MEGPTLKIRLDIPQLRTMGMDCHVAASKLIVVDPDVEILDAKWGRSVSEWNNTGRSWGRVRLNDFQRGYLAACKVNAEEGSAEAQLISIIEGWAK